MNEFAWTRASTSIMFSLNILIYGLAAPIAGRLGDRWQPRRTVIMGAVLLSLATAGCGLATQLWHFYLLFGVLAPIGTAFCGSPLVTPSLANWFQKRRGMAIALGQIGGGLSFAYGVLAETFISQLGWRPAYFILAGIFAAVIIPLFYFIFYHRPEDKGLKAYGAGEATEPTPKPAGLSAVREWTLSTALRSYRLWTLVLANFFYWGLGNYLILAHQVKFAQDAGYSDFFAASVFALFGIISIAGQLASSISDWIGREKTATIAVILAMGAIGSLLMVKDASQPWLLYIYAVSSGLATGLFSPTIFTGVADIFYGRDYGTLASLLLTGMGIGGAIGPWLGGYIFDISGSYFAAFLISLICFGLAGICFWIAAPRRK